MRILLITEAFAPAPEPTAHLARPLVDAWITAGHAVDVLTPTPGVGHYRGARVHRHRLFSLSTLRTLAQRLDPEIVVALAPRAYGTAACRALEGLGLPSRVIDPTPLQPRSGRLLATSRASARGLAAAGLRTTLWAPGVDLAEHHPGLHDPAWHRSWSQRSSAHCTDGSGRGGDLVVAHLGPIGHPASRATRRLLQIADLPGVRLVAFGSGLGVGAVRDRGAIVLSDLGTRDRAAALASSDLLVIPRKHDVDPLPARWALASGVPVLGFATSAAADVICNGVNGLVIGGGSGPHLASLIAELAADRLRLDGLAGNARASVQERPWHLAAAELLSSRGSADHPESKRRTESLLARAAAPRARPLAG